MLMQSVRSDDFLSSGLSLSKWIGLVPGALIVRVFGDAGFLQNADHSKERRLYCLHNASLK
jgi:hypothetical protein